MVSGKPNEKKANKSTKSAIAALTPKSYSDPFGSFNNGAFAPNINAEQQMALNNTQAGLRRASGELVKPFNINDYYNNPFRENTYQMLANPINQQFQQDLSNLDDQLNARGLVGGSYDGLMKKNLLTNRNNNLQQANLQGIAASADAYNQSYNNNLNALGALGNSALQQQQYIYQPMNAAMNYQNAMSPLQQGVANAYNNQANFYQNQAARYDGFTNTANNMMNTMQNYYKTMWSPITTPLNSLQGGGGGNMSQMASMMGGV